MSGAATGRGTAETVPVVVIEELKKRFHAFPVPPARFNPVTASPAQLRELGSPRGLTRRGSRCCDRFGSAGSARR